MKPIFKYSGGKTRELKIIDGIIQHQKFKRIIEPFVGGGAFSFHQEKPALISDTRTNNIDVYKAVKDITQFNILVEEIEKIKIITDVEKLEKIYYYWRDEKFNNCNSLWEKALRWIVIRQLCFSGMDRINKKTGKFNVPFGWYNKFNTKLDIKHHNLIKTWDIQECSFEKSIEQSNIDDFIFLDPPYLDRNSDYGSDTHSMDLHKRLFDYLKNTSSKWLLIHSNHLFYEKTYKNFNILKNDFKYASQWKGRIQKDREVKHLYITNF